MPKSKPILKMPSATRLRLLFRYNKRIGILISRATGKPAGGLKDKRGYQTVRIDYVLYQTHRIIWKLVTGHDPAHTIDHRNGNRSDNRFANLREATPSQQQMNHKLRKDNTSGVRGVYRKGKRWSAFSTR